MHNELSSPTIPCQPAETPTVEVAETHADTSTNYNENDDGYDPFIDGPAFGHVPDNNAHETP